MNSAIQDFLILIIELLPGLIGMKIVFDFIREILFKGWSHD